MATDELRALDEIVARAMGHRLDTCYTGRRIIWPSSGESTIALPRYSTDAACIPEMVAWLTNRPGHVEITVWEGDVVDARLFATALHRKDGTARGSTISEALCRLVEAVAKREGQ